VLVERGEAWFTVAPREQRPAFVVRAGDATVRVVGTRFRVARSDERIAVDVERGLVDVQFHGAMVSVGPGRRWSSETPAQTSTLAGTPPPVPVASGEPAAPATEPPSGVAGAERPAAVAPAPVVPIVVHPPVASSGPPPSAPPRSAPAIDDPPAPKPAARTADHDRIEYDRLAALEAASPDAALTGYLALARGASRWADPALFAAARLAVDRHDRRAETLLGIYLQRFPAGANATDAKQLLARLHRSNGETP
jgi:transmembrane sensor